MQVDNKLIQAFEIAWDSGYRCNAKLIENNVQITSPVGLGQEKISISELENYSWHYDGDSITKEQLEKIINYVLFESLFHIP